MTIGGIYTPGAVQQQTPVMFYPTSIGYLYYFSRISSLKSNDFLGQLFIESPVSSMLKQYSKVC
jgi:hypothetical protein